MAHIHDNEIISYEVDFSNKKLSIKTEIKRSEGDEENMIEFEGLFTYHFENQLPKSILLDIEERPNIDFFTDNKRLLRDKKSFGWPCQYNSMEALYELFEKAQFHYYVITASFGLVGWVVSRSCECIINGPDGLKIERI